MSFSFKAKIYKAGINPCVKVPLNITADLIATKGYIPVKGTINGHFFQQTLCPVKDDKYRLYVNGPMLKGGDTAIGKMAHFIIEQDTLERNKNVPMHKELKKALQQNELLKTFNALSASRQKEINRYLNNIKTETTLRKNIDRIIKAIQGKTTSPLVKV
ncbi:MAG TPA: YdeI/OmpD-associated family protein [Chitinophagaceae bacterium]